VEAEDSFIVVGLGGLEWGLKCWGWC